MHDPARRAVHCSVRCAAAGLSTLDAELENAIEALLAARARGASICPSEACRLVTGGVDRDHMERTRRAARRLVARGLIDITQGGIVVDPSRAKGPIRLRRLDQVAVPERVSRRRPNQES